MRNEIRVIGFDDSPFDKHKDIRVKVIGVLYRGGNFLDGVLSFDVKKDGNDSTLQLIKAINKSKFKKQLRAIFLDGIAFAGFNVIDISLLNEKTKIPVIVVIRRYPDFNKIKKTLKKLNMNEKIKLIENAGDVKKINDVYVQLKSIDLDDAKKMLKITCTHSNIPDPVRVAHLIASGLVLGESKGKA